MTNKTRVIQQGTNIKYIDVALPIRVRRFITGVDGTVIPNPMVPASLQTKYPVFMFGEFDRKGGYKQGLMSNPPVNDVDYLLSFTNGNGFSTESIIGFTGFNTIQPNLLIGDLVHVFCDNRQNPNYFIWIVQTFSKGSIGSIYGNTGTTQKDDKYNRLYFKSIIYTTGNNNFEQWNESLVTVNLNNLGIYRSDEIQPNAFKTPNTFLDNLIKVPFEFLVDQYLGIATYIQWETNEIQFVFKLKKPA